MLAVTRMTVGRGCSRFASLTGAGRPRLHARHGNHMVEIVERGKGAKLTFNSLGIRSPNTPRLHRPTRVRFIASLQSSRNLRLN